jgi:hypothetical protein
VTARSGHTIVSSPEAAGKPAWRSIGASVISTGVPTAVGMVHPFIGIGFAAAELAVALTVIATALFGSRELSERAFRLLRWIGNRPEPPSPQGGKRPRHARSS